MSKHIKQQMLETLKSARLLIEKGWTKEHFAIDMDGYSVLPSDKEAVAFCLIGSISQYPNCGEAIKEMMTTLGLGIDTTLSVWNDKEERTKEEVLACIDQTIARLEAELAT